MEDLHILFEKIGSITPDDIKKGKAMHGYENVNVYMLFELYMDRKFTIRARLVADIHTTSPASSITYSRVVYIVSVMISLIPQY